MMERYYRFAGVEVLVSMEDSLFYRDERRLAPFRVEKVTDPWEFHFQMAEELPEPQGKLVVRQPAFSVWQEEGTVRYIGGETPRIRILRQGKRHWVLVRRNPYSDTIGTKTVLECMGAEHLIAQNHGFVFHCSYIAYEGQAILFTAPSETGKSTQAELWRRLRGAEIINGDRAAVHLADRMLYAEGIPFSGSSRDCENRSLPIRAIVYLGQAPQTSIRRMRGYEAFSRIWEGVSVNTWDKDDVERVSAVVQQAAGQIPLFHLPCTPDESAVTALEAELRKLETL